MAESKDWIVKILSGPHQGAEVLLAPGRMRVGSDADCDLVLHDVLIAPHHFALVLEAGGLRLEALDGPVHVGGKRLTQGGVSVPPFAFITAGTTHLVAGPSQARWPLISIADAPTLEPERAPAAAEAAVAAASPESSAETSEAGKNTRLPTADQRRRAWWLAGAGGVLLIIWLVLWFSWGRLPEPAPVLPDRTKVEEVLATFRPQADGVQVSEEHGALVVSGYVPNDEVLRRLSEALREAVPTANHRLWSEARLADTARSLLAERRLTYDVATAGGGILRIRGMATSAEEWSKTRQLLLSEVPGLTSLSEEVTYVSPARPSGASTPSAASAPQPSAAAPAARFRIVAVQPLSQGQGWVRLNDNRVFFRGAELPGGARIRAVTTGAVRVDTPAGEMELPVGSELGETLASDSTTEATTVAQTPLNG